jgi:putative toxin-antitoxin system antitoxin component (TIGR02293 family)
MREVKQRVATRLAERLGHLVEKTDLDQAEVARVLGTSTRTVSRWLRDQVAPRREFRERLLEFLAVLERLSMVLRPEPAHDWLFTPNPLLDYHKPADLLRGGKFREVLAAVDALGEGVFV